MDIKLEEHVKRFLENISNDANVYVPLRIKIESRLLSGLMEYDSVDILDVKIPKSFLKYISEKVKKGLDADKMIMRASITISLIKHLGKFEPDDIGLYKAQEITEEILKCASNY